MVANRLQNRSQRTRLLQKSTSNGRKTARRCTDWCPRQHCCGRLSRSNGSRKSSKYPLHSPSHSCEAGATRVWGGTPAAGGTTTLHSPSPNTPRRNEDRVTQNILLGTYSAGSETQEYLQVGQVQYPSSFKDGDVGSQVASQVVIKKQFAHNGDVNRARYQPQSPNIVATASVSGDIYIYDIQNPTDQTPRTLKHHTENGYGLTWNPVRAGLLATGSDDSTVAIWDTNKEGEIRPSIVYSHHTDIVNDVDWHREGNLLGSVSDDKSLLIYDTRDSSNQPHLSVKEAHSEAVNSLAFSPFSRNMLATVSADQTVALWDMRNLSKTLHSLIGHNQSVTSVKWSPHIDGTIATAGTDRRVVIWDISRIGEEQTPEDAEDGPPELTFMHGGHTSAVTDFDWNPVPEYSWIIGSTSEDNIGQYWAPLESITQAGKPVVRQIDPHVLE
ncbi:Hat2p [Sugiyamaella lignohabitans]|uniref:Hat2p n=1 Tax=Sugiyamaella lignohabitans TaxID=796027 RepID=A0A167CC03_9ASCO|nr:Hat2p [Sugiyamaella lignohabitans]ANB11486.1 Hat2p [Sugiyamaella lignohabitans]